MYRISIIWNLKCWSWLGVYNMKIHQLFYAKHGVKKRWQTWRQVVSSTNNRWHVWNRFFFFDTMYGIKKLSNILPAITCLTSVNESSYETSNVEVDWVFMTWKYISFFTPNMGLKTVTDMSSIVRWWYNLMPCLSPFFLPHVWRQQAVKLKTWRLIHRH